MRGRRKGKGIVIAFLAPAILLYSIFEVYPALDAFRICFFEYTGYYLTDAEFIGLANFREVVKDKIIRLALINNILIMTVGGALIFSLALFFAVVVGGGGGFGIRIRGSRIFRTIIFFPYILSEVAIALLWTFIYNPRWGMLNLTLRAIGLGSLAKPWLAKRELAMPAIIFVIAWSAVGFYMTLLMAGIRSIPEDYYDAARVDGANDRQLFFHITLPLLRDVLVIGIVYWMIRAVKMFGIIWAMTKGGPANFTHVMSTYMYQMAFPYQVSILRLGYATTIAVAQLGLVIILSILFFRLTTREIIY